MRPWFIRIANALLPPPLAVQPSCTHKKTLMASATILISFRFLHARSHSLLTIHRHHHRHPSPSLLTFHQLPEQLQRVIVLSVLSRVDCSPTLSLSLRLSIPHNPLSHPDTPGLLCFSSGQIYVSIDIAFFFLILPSPQKRNTVRQKFSRLSLTFWRSRFFYD